MVDSMGATASGPDPRVTAALQLMGCTQVEPGENRVAFRCGPLDGRAYLRPGGDRLRGHVVLARLDDDPEPALDWLDKQPLAASGVVEVVNCGDEGHLLRLLFERGTDAVSPEDPLPGEAAAYADAWSRRVVVPDPIPKLWESLYFSDPVERSPQNAWLMLGSEASYPTEDELFEDQVRGLAGVYERLWTASKQTVPGDLLLFYYLSPRKAVCFVARAASRAFYDADISVNASGNVRDEQWWCYTTPLVALTPINVDVLRNAADGHLILRGRSGRYLRPEVVAALEFTAADTNFLRELEAVAVSPVGRADLPDPETLDLATWRELAGGAMRLEADVERHVVEPLVRLALDSAKWRDDLVRQFRIGRRVADYVVLRQGQPHCVIEVKLAVRGPRDGGWSSSPDVRQLLAYARTLRCPGMLIDAQRILLFDRGATEPAQVFDRLELTSEQLKQIGRHLRGS